MNHAGHDDHDGEHDASSTTKDTKVHASMMSHAGHDDHDGEHDASSTTKDTKVT